MVVAPGRTEEGMQVTRGKDGPKEKGKGRKQDAGRKENCRARRRKKVEEEGN